MRPIVESATASTGVTSAYKGMLGAAGGIESVVSAMAIHKGVVPPTINLNTPDPECDLDYVPNTAREATVKAVLNNSLGFGGHNACLCFKQCD